MLAFPDTTALNQRLCALLLLSLLSLLPPAWGQRVVTDIMPDGFLGTIVTPNADGSIHTIEGGTIQGPNQFHSFDRFDLGSGETARFTGPVSIEHIMSRVTGGQESLIDGALRSDIAGADLYLLNPSGVMFGPGARLDVQGSFHVSTSEMLQLGENGVFHVSLDEQSMLSVSVPSAFGFLQNNPVGVRIEGSNLEVPTDQTLSVVGGDIQVVGNRVPSSPATLGAPSGQIHLVSVASRGDVALLPTDSERSLNVNRFTRLGVVTITDSALVDVSSSAGGGTVAIRGDRLIIDNSLIFADTVGEQDGSSIGIDIDVTNDLILTNGTLITTGVFASGNTGDIRVTVAKLELLNGAEISSINFAQGNAGKIEVSASELRIDGGDTDQFTGIVSNADSSSSGAAGTVTVTVQGLAELLNGSVIGSATFGQVNAGGVEVSAGELRVEGTPNQFTGISSRANRDSSGAAGTVRVIVQGLAQLLSGAQISSNTFAQGNAGNVEVLAGELRIVGTPSRPTGIASTAESDSFGDVGMVKVTVQGLAQLLNGASIVSNTFAQGDAGSVEVSAGELHIDDLGTPNQFTGIASNAEPDSSGAAGAVEVTVQGLAELLNGAEISSSTFALGNAGSIEVSAGELRIDDLGTLNQFTGIASTANRDSSGAAGAVEVTVQGLAELLNGAEISSNTFALGNAGSVEVSAGELRIDGRGIPNQFTGIASNAEPGSSGTAGTVKVTVKGLGELLNGAGISSSTFTRGNAGIVEVSTGALYIDGGGTEQLTGITSNAASGSSGAAGSVEVMVHGLAQLLNGAQISSNAAPDSSGAAGMVKVTIQGLAQLLNGASIISSTFAQGDAGRVEVFAGELYIDGGGVLNQFTGIASNAEPDSSGVAGKVKVQVQRLAQLLNGAEISSNTFAQGDAGSVEVKAGELRIDDLGTPDQFTGVASGAGLGSSGAAGTVTVAIEGLAQLLNGAEISSSTFAQGNAGSVGVGE